MDLPRGADVRPYWWYAKAAALSSGQPDFRHPRVIWMRGTGSGGVAGISGAPAGNRVPRDLQQPTNRDFFRGSERLLAMYEHGKGHRAADPSAGGGPRMAFTECGSAVWSMSSAILPLDFFSFHSTRRAVQLEGCARRCERCAAAWTYPQLATAEITNEYKPLPITIRRRPPAEACVRRIC